MLQFSNSLGLRVQIHGLHFTDVETSSGSFHGRQSFPPMHRHPRLAHLARVFWCWILRFERDVCTICLSGVCCLLLGAAHTWGGTTPVDPQH